MATDILSEIGEKMAIVAILVLFLNHFMRELKTVQHLREKDRKESDRKFEEIFSRQFEIERQNIEAIAKQCDTNLRLTEAINNLSEQIEQMKR